MTFVNIVATSLRIIVRPAVARSVLALVAGLLILATVVSQAAVDARPATSPDGSNQALAAGSRIRYLGRDWYLHGANVPWLNWAADFGGGTGNNGVTSSASQTALKSAFQQAKDSGVTNVRWWVFEGDPWQIRRDGSNAPTSLDSAIYPDFDAAVALAETYDLYLDFVLFSAPSHLPASWLSNPTQRNQLGTALEPLFARYAGNPHVMAWEVFNEPDFDVWAGHVTEADLRATVSVVASAVHRKSSAFVTVGMGFADGLPMVQGLGLDFYQAHWYDYMGGGDYCMRCNSYSFYQSKDGLDAPLVVGELYAGSDTDALQRMEDFYAKGYAGAWPWSMFPNSTSDHLAIDWNAAHTFSTRHADVGPHASSGPNPATSTPTTTPTSTVTPTATVTPTRGPATATPTPTAQPCVPRPRVSVSATSGGSGLLNVTVSVSGATNAIGELRFGTARNAVIDLPDGRTGQTGGITYRPTSRQSRVTFQVRRTATGGATVPFTVVDDCGTWQTFVGGGRTVGF
jgi:hypothetical protein